MNQHQWWRDAVIYQVYPRSFADGDGDGYGDLPGIIERLPYLVDLGVDAVWLSPFYLSPMADGGYDVADYRTVDPLFGKTEDAHRLVARAHELGLRVIFDLVPNHTSDEHEWFQAAVAAGPGSAERDLYIFRDGRGVDGEEAPNNWRSVFGGPGWTRLTRPDGTPEQWYLHLFDGSQPDLNWNSPRVREEFEAILRYWLDADVDGFRVDVAHGLVKADGLPDETRNPELLGLQAGPMWDQDGVHEIYRSWRRVLDSYDADRILVAEAWVHTDRIANYVRPDEMNQAFNFEFLECAWDAAAYQQVITSSLAKVATVGAPTTWVLSNHDVLRHRSRLGRDDTSNRYGIGASDPQPDNELGLARATAATLMMLALPGSAYLYQGEELGLPDHTTLPDDLRQDPTWFRSNHTEVGRDGCRVPIPWEADAPGLGFSPTGQTWLPQPDSYRQLAVDQQQGVDGSVWTMYRDALRLRKELALGTGELEWEDLGEGVVAFRNGDLLVATNVSAPTVDLPEGEVLLASGALEGNALPVNTTVWLR
ncbi:glycoside hydrolase family 13 protein [Tessaracoccus sp. OS52]|uniref:glycoside hydrolase family 13 protein n=1 Tax=Tessaracoccus sp. OS52 TaxID=2886691 RepID=UPI001D130571|nr:alpha-amylase family glycosyl hydrolase [Tessaracoccus sp. OS52]MCC2592099.1 glycoside hydrolase family 13 protein [Tessaracoccus sp. OS52]